MAGMKDKGILYPLVGVDFGSQSIKAVAVSGKASDYQISAVAEVPVPKGAIVDYQFNDVEKVIAAVRTLMKHIHGSSRYIATSVSGSSVISKIIQAEATMKGAELNSFVSSEAEQLIPFPLDEINLDYEVLGPNLIDNTKIDVLVSGARTDSVDSRKVVFDAVGKQVKVVDVSVHALGRAIKSVVPGFNTTYGEKTIAIVDVGAVTLSFGVLYQGEVIYQRLQSFGGDNVSKSLSEFYGMPYEEAEKNKIENRMPADAANEVLTPYMNQLAQQIKRNIQLFTSSTSHREIDVVILTGGGCLLPGLADQMSSLLRIEVKCPDIFKKFPKLANDTNKMGCKYMTALGLALRSFETCQI